MRLVLHTLHDQLGVAALQALAEKNAAIAESERCQRKLGLANRLIAALASEGDRWALTVQQLRKDYQVRVNSCMCACALQSCNLTSWMSLCCFETQSSGQISKISLCAVFPGLPTVRHSGPTWRTDLPSGIKGAA